MPPDQAFLKELRELWDRNLVAAVLLARLNYDRIPSDVVAVARGMNQNFREDQAIHDAVNAAMGSMGIFGGGGGRIGMAADPIDFMFYATMGLIVTHRGNPPAAPGLRALARRIVTGEVDPFTVFDVANPQVPGLGGIVRTLLAFTPQILPMFRGWALIMAASAVPGDEIAGLLGISPEQRFKDAIKAAAAAMQANDTAELHRQMGIALNTARVTGGTEDDLQAASLVVAMGAIGSLTPENLRLAIAALGRVAADNANAGKAAPVLAMAMPMLQTQGLTKELGGEAVRIGKLLLTMAQGTNRLDLLLATAWMLLQLGKTAQAEGLVSDAKREFKAPDQRMRIAQLDADVSWANGDQDGATDIIISALEDADKAPSTMRVMLLQKLLAVWPAEREGLDPWLGRLQNEAGRLDEPQASIVRLTAGLALFKTGRQEQGKALVERVDLDKVERMAPGLRDMVRQIREALKAFGFERVS